MSRRFRVIPRARARVKAKRPLTKLTDQARTVTHKYFGDGVLRFVQVLDDGQYAVVATFPGSGDRLIRLEARYWDMPISALTKVAMQLPGRPIAKAKPEKEVKSAEPGEDTETDAIGDELTADELGTAEIAPWRRQFKQ